MSFDDVAGAVNDRPATVHLCRYRLRVNLAPISAHTSMYRHDQPAGCAGVAVAASRQRTTQPEFQAVFLDSLRTARLLDEARDRVRILDIGHDEASSRASSGADARLRPGIESTTNATLLSDRDTARVGLNIDTAAVTEVDVLVDSVRKGFAAVVALADK